MINDRLSLYHVICLYASWLIIQLYGGMVVFYHVIN